MSLSRPIVLHLWLIGSGVSLPTIADDGGALDRAPAAERWMQSCSGSNDPVTADLQKEVPTRGPMAKRR